ncbi:polysaccharide deacetylase family protein [Actinomadura atramentaria]|uniref:polysaccharide deacetylase family protein n=1 Tax=Actinomadura atramentaria TaxID=1990 RepID=UPI00039EB28B|nr:polysaccharide deacetylase family protein [Actinomadura atramentaria]
MARETAGTAVHPPPEVGSAPGWPVVLYFHHVDPDIRHYTCVSPAAFDAALAGLGERFRPLDPRAVPAVVEAGGSAEPTCLLTFDDGYADVLEHALPIMERRGWRAVHFVSTDLVGTVEDHPVRGRLRHLTWDELAELTRRGHVVASHGCSHTPFDRLPPAEVRREAARAGAVLAARLPGAPDWLAYPYGIPPGPGVELPELCFGSVKAPALAWDAAPREIRRTYLPADGRERWETCMDEWRRPWSPGASL